MPPTVGDLTGRCVGDLGSGTARHAVHLAVHHRLARVIAVDASPAQHAMAGALYGHLAPRLRLVNSDVTRHLHNVKLRRRNRELGTQLAIAAAQIQHLPLHNRQLQEALEATSNVTTTSSRIQNR